jgi:hypothetical protein
MYVQYIYNFCWILDYTAVVVLFAIKYNKACEKKKLERRRALNLAKVLCASVVVVGAVCMIFLLFRNIETKQNEYREAIVLLDMLRQSNNDK